VVLVAFLALVPEHPDTLVALVALVTHVLLFVPCF